MPLLRIFGNTWHHAGAQITLFASDSGRLSAQVHWQGKIEFTDCIKGATDIELYPHDYTVLSCAKVDNAWRIVFASSLKIAVIKARMFFVQQDYRAAIRWFQTALSKTSDPFMLKSLRYDIAESFYRSRNYARAYFCFTNLKRNETDPGLFGLCTARIQVCLNTLT